MVVPCDVGSGRDEVQEGRGFLSMMDGAHAHREMG